MSVRTKRICYSVNNLSFEFALLNEGCVDLDVTCEDSAPFDYEPLTLNLQDVSKLIDVLTEVKNELEKEKTK